MTRLSLPGLEPTHPETTQRWFAWKNVDTITAPPYALLELRFVQTRTPENSSLGEDEDSHPERDNFAGILDGSPVWKARQTASVATQWFEPRFYFCNGPTPVPPNGYGRCTQDWPCRVLADFQENNPSDTPFRTGVGSYVIPYAGTWGVRWTGHSPKTILTAPLDPAGPGPCWNAFVILSFDPTVLPAPNPGAEDESKVIYNLVWIAPSGLSYIAHYHPDNQLLVAMYAHLAGATTNQ